MSTTDVPSLLNVVFARPKLYFFKSKAAFRNNAMQSVGNVV